MSAFNLKSAAAAVVLGLLASNAAGAEQERKVKITVHNAGRIYHPSDYSERSSYKKLGTLVSRRVFDETTEYKQIAKRKLTPNTAEWCLLAKAASDKFKRAVAKAVKTGGLDLVAEIGAVSVDGQTIPDVTSEVIAQLPSE